MIGLFLLFGYSLGSQTSIAQTSNPPVRQPAGVRQEESLRSCVSILDSVLESRESTGAQVRELSLPDRQGRDPRKQRLIFGPNGQMLVVPY